jgi:hypothetical protein
MREKNARANGQSCFLRIPLTVEMTFVPTSHQTAFLSELAAGHSGPPVPLEKRAYFQTRLRNRLFDFVLKRFSEEQKKGLTKAILARRIGKTPDVVSRLLGAPGNWTLDTVSDLLIGIGAEELDPIASSSLLNRQSRNYRPNDYIGAPDLGWIAEQRKEEPPPVHEPFLLSRKPEGGLKPSLGKAA